MPDPLVIDNRVPGAAPTPGLHVICIGVSNYQNLVSSDEPAGDGFRQLKKLRSSAISAMQILDKIVDLDSQHRLFKPLATARLLLAPSQLEIDADARLATQGAGATIIDIIKALNAWRKDVALNRDNQALFFFSGHGMRRSPDESIVLASDFLEEGLPMLRNAFNTANVRSGMAPGHAFEEIGRQQFYFVDACRDMPEALAGIDSTDTSKIFDIDLNSLDDRAAPIFFPTVTGGQAYGVAGKPTFFTQALLWAMEHGAIDKRRLDGIEGSVWPVNADSLKLGIIAANPMFAGRLELKGSVGNAILCHRATPPELKLKLSLSPLVWSQKVTSVVMCEVNRDVEFTISSQGQCGPFEQSISAGMYQAKVRPALRKPGRSKSEVVALTIQSEMPWIFDLVGVA